MRGVITAIATAGVCAAVFGALNVGAQVLPGYASRPERCTPPTGSGFRATFMSNTDGRVWTKETRRNNIVTRKYYACSNRLRRHVYLATTKHQDLTDEGETPPFSSMQVRETSFDGTAVAFVKTTCNPAGENAKCTYLVRWLRLKDKKIIRDFHTSGAERPDTPVIRADAIMVWPVASADPACKGLPCEARMAGVAGDRTIDSGPDISGLGIGNDERTFYWRKGNDVRGLEIGGELLD